MEHKNTVKRDRLYVGELVIPYEYRLKNDGKILVYKLKEVFYEII